ncbi:capsid protein [robinz virus RP_404]|nr:capsid protein [robinz virus RP_404]
MRFRRSRRRRRHRRTFNQKVGRAMLKFAETKRLLDPVTQATFTCGDGTSRTLYIANPVANLTQGTSGDDISGNTFWIKALWLRGRISLDQTTNSLRVRILLIKSRQFADLPPGFTTYGNTTTVLTNPTQTAADGETNLRIFETTDAEEAGQPSAPFVGNASGIDIIDNDLVHVLGGKEFFLSTQHLLNFQNVDIYVPVNQKFKIYSEIGATPTDQLRTVDGYNYYWILQVFSNSNANNILVAQDILGTFDIITYHKEI